MNKRLLNSAIAFATMALLIACSDDDNKIEPTPTAPAPSTPTSKGAYVLSSGYWGENNASIQYIDLENHRVINDDMYFYANGEKLGDSGQDLILYGSKLYCTVSTSEKVVIMDKSCKVLKSHSLYVDPDILPNDIIIDSDPRYLAAHNGKVYFTSYDGTVSRIDTTTLEIEAKATEEVQKLIDNSTGKLKEKYRFLQKLITSTSLQSEVVHVGNELGGIIDIFGKRLYSMNDTELLYSEMGNRLANQRNNYAHGNLNIDFIGDSLIDVVYAERIVYAMQLKRYGVEPINIQKSINELFRCGLLIEEGKIGNVFL